ncbi:hypothetical protein [Bradyrhizobium sp. Tv2a-2]|uniref:hypothetical protein n=1 Tax=Bradyrhizobium sp. Tv2a-2 TaxID=113395 RepID=UPI00041D0BF1|nr:hypothetical protein [Bradyrhizobium sp. Tv2a-2]
MNRSLLFIACALVLAGCANEAADLGRPVPTGLVTLHREVEAPSGSYSNKARRLRRQAAFIAEGDMQAVRADIVAAPPGEAEVLRHVLIGAGIDPARITVSSFAVLPRAPNPRRKPFIIFTRTIAAPTDCRASIDFAFPDDPSPSLMSLAHCLQTRDLAAMLVDPADLVVPPKLGRGDGAYLANGIRAWRTHGSEPGATASPDGNNASSTASQSVGTTGGSTRTTP